MAGKERFPQLHHPLESRATNFRLSTHAPFAAVVLSIAVATAFVIVSTSFWTFTKFSGFPSFVEPSHAVTPNFKFNAEAKQAILSRCALLRATPHPPESFHSREESERFESGTNATLIRNALIFTGRDNGTDVIHGDILLDKGIVKGIGKISGRVIDNTPNLTIVNANGAWVTPGLGNIFLYFHLLQLL
jgi:hypothetical protein